MGKKKNKISKEQNNRIQSQYLSNLNQKNDTKSKELPYMCLLMIVKNESHVITQTLDILHKLIDYWIICDTGSTDGTQDLIRNYFLEKNIPGELVEHEWKNFGHNRTQAFDCAYKKSKYVFVFDADDLIHGDFYIPKNFNGDAYSLKFGQVYTYTRPQIFRNSLKWCYRGVLHEFADCIDKKNCTYTLIEGNYYVESRRLGSRNSDPDKYLKDANLLLSAINEKRDPDLKGRYLFYLAQSYRDYKDIPNAIKYYMERAEFGGWDEEVYYSCWQIGILMYQVDGYTDNDKINWFLKGYKKCSYRGEVLSEIGKIYFNQNEYMKAYSYFLLLYKLNIPKGVLFSDDSCYTSTCKLYLSIICLHLNKQDESDFYYNLLLKEAPILEADKLNLELYEFHKNKNVLFKNYHQFDDYVFYPYKDVYGFDIEYKGENCIQQLYEQAKCIENCNAFNTLGYYKNIDLNNYVFIDFYNDRHLLQVHGIYIKKN